ncbi:MAG: zf-HC2 domain-containing protein [Vicinamibacterales bacterium]
MTRESEGQAVDCRQIEAALPPFVDGEAQPATAAMVQAHLDACPACRRAAELQGAVRALLVSRRSTLADPLPDGLRAAVERAAAPRPPRPAARFTAFAAAAAVVLTAVAGLTWATGHSSVLLAAQLTLDHLKCFVIDGGDDHPALEADAAHARVRLLNGEDVDLPVPSAGGRARLVAVRECLYGDGWVPHALYRVDGQPVSVFVLGRRQAAAGTVAAFGRLARVVERAGTTYVVVAPAGATAVAAAVGLGAE